MVLWKKEDIIALTGWGHTHLSMLCKTGQIPYIHGNPYRFIESEVKKAIVAMQCGGPYGRRKPKKRKAPIKVAA